MEQSKRLPDVQKIATFSVVDKEGNPHPFADFWQEQCAVLVFIRHFG